MNITKRVRLACVLTVTGLLVYAHNCRAAEQQNLLESITWSAVGAVKHVDITDHADVGAGVAVGLPINKYVDLRTIALSYEDKNWGGSAIDELGVGIKVNLVKGLQEKLHLYGTGTGYRDFENEDWRFGTGLGLQYNFTKNFNAGVGTEIRAGFKERKDLLTTGSLNFKF